MFQGEDLIHFTVVTVVKNDLVGLMRSRESLESQRYKKWTHVIVDGGSTDKTLSYLKKLPKENTIYISEPDNGIYDAMNKGWRLAEDNSFVFFLNARDVMADPKSLTNARISLNADMDSNWGCTTHEEINEDGTGWVCKLISPPSVTNQLYAFGYRSHQAVVMRKAMIEKLGGFNENFKIAADWDLIVRAINFENPTLWKQPLARFELGGMSSGRILEAHLELKKLRRDYLKPSFTTRIVDDLWCAIYLHIFNFRNYWTPLLHIAFPRHRITKRRHRKTRRINFYLDLLGVRIHFSRKPRKTPPKKRRKIKINRPKIQFMVTNQMRRYLGISDYS